MTTKKLVAVVALATATSACALGTAIPIAGGPRWTSALAGEWYGTYVRDDGRRDGAIWFVLKSGEGHAHGDVRMTPRSGAPYGQALPGREWERGDRVTFLAIRFVHVGEAGLEGTLEPYWDPECQCRAMTTFRGQLAGDRLSGTFLTRLETGAWAAGRWQAERSRRAGAR